MKARLLLNLGKYPKTHLSLPVCLCLSVLYQSVLCLCVSSPPTSLSPRKLKLFFSVSRYNYNLFIYIRYLIYYYIRYSYNVYIYYKFYLITSPLTSLSPRKLKCFFCQLVYITFIYLRYLIHYISYSYNVYIFFFFFLYHLFILKK